jgi:hypothetical protein
MSCVCGATENCPIELVEDRAGHNRVIADTGGWGLYVYPRPEKDLHFVHRKAEAKPTFVT